MKLFSLLFAFVVSAAALPQNLGQKVTFQTKAAPLGQVLDQLTKQTNVPLSYDPAMAGEILVISVNDAPLSDLLKQIAVAADGQVNTESGVRFLPDSAKRDKETQEDLKARLDVLTTMMKDVQGRDLPPGPLTLLSQQDLSQVVAVLSGQRIVFSTNPTANQLPISGVTAEFVASLLHAPGEAAPAQPRNLTPAQERNEEERQPSQAILAVANQSDTLQARIIVYDRLGRELTVENEDLSLKAEPKATQVPDSLAKISSSQVQTSDITNELEKSGFFSGTAGVNELSTDELNVLKHPDTQDPLSFFASDALLQLAQESGEQLVADVPDSLVDARSGTALQFVTEQCATGAIKATEDNGWLVISPANPAESRQERANRPALATLIQEAHQKRDACLTDMANFAIADGHPPLTAEGEPLDASAPYLRLFIPEWRDFLEPDNQFNVLAFYGLLSSDQKSALLSGRELPVGDLSENARSMLNLIAFGAYATYRVQPASSAVRRPGPKELMPGVIVERPRVQKEQGMQLGQSSYLSEPTELLAQGIPPEAYIKLGKNSTAAASNGGAGGLNRFNFEFYVAPRVYFQAAIEEPQAGP